MLILSNVTARGIDIQQAGMVSDVLKTSGLQYWFTDTYLLIYRHVLTDLQTRTYP